jgi:hypothetical protein
VKALFPPLKVNALLCFFAFVADPGWAAKAAPKPLPIKLTAKITNRFNWDTKKDNIYEDTSQTTMEINAQMKYLPNPNVQVVVGEWTADKKVRPYNIYVNLAYEHINFRLGNQIVRWGKADEISPLDVVNPEDLSLGFTRTRSDRKIPVPMANLEFLSDAISLQGIYIPFFQKSIFHYYGMIGLILATWKRNTAERSTLSRTNPRTLSAMRPTEGGWRARSVGWTWP